MMYECSQNARGMATEYCLSIQKLKKNSAENLHRMEELLHVKYGRSVLLHFDSADIDIVIEQLCTE